MDNYTDIEVRPDPEFTTELLMSVLYEKLHLALVSTRTNNLGVSFPDHSNSPRTLGGRLRLHSNATTLSLLMGSGWLSGMSDHVTISEILKAPSVDRHRVVRRVQGKTNVERLRRRHAKRHGLSMEETRKIIPESVEARVKLPFAMLRSYSTDRRFPLFVEHLPVQTAAKDGAFNYYGLSAGATIPWF